MPTDNPSAVLVSERTDTFTCLILLQSIEGGRKQRLQGEKPILSRCHSLDPFSRPWRFMKRNTVQSDEHFKSKRSKNGKEIFRGSIF